MTRVPDRPKQSATLHSIKEDLHGGPSGPYDGGMEQRVRQLETDMSFIKGKLGDMPTKDWMNTRLLAYFGALAAFIAILRFVGSGV